MAGLKRCAADAAGKKSEFQRDCLKRIEANTCTKVRTFQCFRHTCTAASLQAVQQLLSGSCMALRQRSAYPFDLWGCIRTLSGYICIYEREWCKPDQVKMYGTQLTGILPPEVSEH